MKPLFNLNEDIATCNDVIIYGAGATGQAAFKKLFQRNIEVRCFADNNPDNCNKKIFNIPVIHIGKLADFYTTTPFIIAGLYLYDIESELRKLGVTNIYFDYGSEFDVFHFQRGAL